MDQKYRRILPASICQLVNEVEEEMGSEIIVDDKYVFSGIGKEQRITACVMPELTPDCKLSGVIGVKDNPRADQLAHEVMHLHRYFVDGVPAFRFPNSPRPDPASFKRPAHSADQSHEQFILQSDCLFDNDMEHLWMLPRLAEKHGFDIDPVFALGARRIFESFRTQAPTAGGEAPMGLAMKVFDAWLQARLVCTKDAELRDLGRDALSRWDGWRSLAVELEQDARAALNDPRPVKGKERLARALQNALHIPGGFYGAYFKRRVHMLFPICE